MPELSDSSTRFQLTLAMLVSVLVVVLMVMVLSTLKIGIPEFVSGVVVMGFMTMLKDAYASYFKAREEIQQARIAATNGTTK